MSTTPIDRKKKYYCTYKLRKSGVVVQTSQKTINHTEPEAMNIYQKKWSGQLQDSFNYAIQTTLKL
jgi:hypothetical protein